MADEAAGSSATGGRGPEEDLSLRIVRELAAAGPPGWQRIEAVFAMTVAAEIAHVGYVDGTRVVRVDPSAPILELVRRQRRAAAATAAGPWWRLLLRVDDSGAVEVDYDYGEQPFPDAHLLPSRAYLADLEAFPRPRLPVWLAAYLRHDERQLRSPRRAHSDAAHGARPSPTDPRLPPLDLLWARWTCLAAAFVAVGSSHGPRIRPSLAWFDNATRCGSTLSRLPGGRAVLSGGVWNDARLDAAYNGGAPLPDLYRGAPEWVANPVLNPRINTGLLSFCHWWDGQCWEHGDSPPLPDIATALPGVWTADLTAEAIVEVVAEAVADRPDAQPRSAARLLVSAAETGVVTRDVLTRVCGRDDAVDIAGALYQFTLAGLTVTGAASIGATDAIDRVRRLLPDPAAGVELTAERLDGGWRVATALPPGEIALNRAVFYVGDDGVVEHSRATAPPSIADDAFARRARQRMG